jgi:8-oxo-dGTP pyrophosphatase MutT (NUDIX family)
MELFSEYLRRRLASDLPGESAQFRMAPAGRPRATPISGIDSPARQSAVLIYLFPQRDGWHTVLMKRPHYDGVHSGQVSIPGGQLEDGETHRQAALREFREETGVWVDDRQLLGTLSDLFIPTSNFLVRPFVACAAAKPRFAPDPVEVEAIIELSVRALIGGDIEKSGILTPSIGGRIEAPYFDVHNHRVWGATAMILSELKEILRDSAPYCMNHRPKGQ